MTTHLLALDAGGGGGHAALVDVERGTLTRAFRPWGHLAAPGTGGLGVDLDLESMWRALGEAAREALARAGAEPRSVAGVAATSMRHTTVVLDVAGRVLLAASNRDTRALGEALETAESMGEDVYAIAGRWPTPIFSGARLRWMAQSEPELWSRARAVVSLNDWLAHRMCGRVATDPSQASETMLLDVARRSWSDALARRLDVPRAVLPELLPSGERLGRLSGDAAEALGLPAGIAVGVGGADTQCGLLGTGAVAPGEVGIVGGTTVPVQMVTGACVLDERRRLWTACHLLPGRWVVESNAGAMGEMLSWLAGTFFPHARTPEARFLAEAALREPGRGGVISSLGTHVMDARRLDLPIGWLALTHLVASDDADRRAHVARAWVDGAACAVRANLAQILEAAPGEPGRLHFAGGMSRDPELGRAIAEVTGRPVELGTTFDATALGAAICAGVAAGVFRDLEEGARALAAPTEAIQPDPRRVAGYDSLFAGWNRLRLARGEIDGIARDLVLPALLESLDAHARRPALGANRPTMLVTAELDARSLERLRRLGDVEYAPFRETMRLLSGDALVGAAAGRAILVTEVDLVDAAALERLPDLRVVVSCRGDAVNVDVEACAAHGIPVLHTPGRNADAVADLSVAFMLALARRLPEALSFLREPGIRPGDVGRMGQAFLSLQGRELWGKTVGLVGFGAVGRAVARRLAGFGARVVVHDPHVSSGELARADVEAATLESLLEQSDVVSLHAAVTDETRGLIGPKQLAAMKPGSFLVNTARAALVDEDALYEALSSGRLGGAGLDVFSVEPPGSDHPLLQLANVIATPHVGGNTAEVSAHQGEIAVAEIERLLTGERPRHVLDARALERFDWRSARAMPDEETRKRLRERPPPSVSDQKPTAAKATPPPAAGPEVPTAPPEVRAALERLLDRFLARAREDTRLREAAVGKEVTLRFTLPDAGLSFHLALRGGAVAAALGDADRPADVELRMRAEVLDGIFRGTLNGMQAATQGRLSFTGDVMKAMTLQALQPDLERLYAAAREEVGDPGDLAAIPGAAPAPQARLAARGDEDLRTAIVHVIRELYEAELITATGGNVSARAPGSGEIWITPSQLFKGELTPEMLVRIDLDGRPLDPDAASPSSERLMHAAVYRARPEACAVVHAHAPNVTVLADAELPFLPVSTEAAFFGDIPRIPFVMPGTPELADAVAEAMRGSWAVILQNHGLLVAGRSLRRAADMVEVVERSAEVIVGCHALGRTPTVLPADVVARLRKMGDMLA